MPDVTDVRAAPTALPVDDFAVHPVDSHARRGRSVDIRTLVVDDDQDSCDLIERVLKKEGYRVGTLTDPRKVEDELHRNIGTCIRDLRKKRSLTLKQLAKRTGLSVSLLSQIERAESSASVTSLYKIAHALKIRLPELFARV